MNGRPGEAGTPTRRISARDFAAVLFRRKWIIVAVFAVTTGVTAGIILSQPTVYESTGKVLLKRGMKDNLFESYQRTLAWEEDLASEIETARSAAVVAEAQKIVDAGRRAAGRPALVIDPGGVDAAVLGESNVIAVSYRSRVPEVCVEVTGAMLTAYTEYRRQAYTLPYPAEFFDAETRRVHDEIQGLQAQRRDLLAGAQLVDGTATDRYHLMSAKGGAQNVTRSLEQDVALMRSSLEQMRAYQADPLSSPDIPFVASTGSGNEMVIAEIKGDLVKAQIRHAELSSVYKQDVPELVRLREQIDYLRKLLDTEVRNRIRVSEMQLANKEAELAEARTHLQESQGRLDALPAQEARLVDLDRRIAAQQENYKDLIEKAEQAKIQQETSPRWTVLVLAGASAPYAKNTRDYVRIALAPIFSLIVGLGLAFFVDSLDTTVKTPREVEEALELPVLATLTERKR